MVATEWIKDRTPPKPLTAPSLEANYWDVLCPGNDNVGPTWTIIGDLHLEGCFFDRCSQPPLRNEISSEFSRVRRDRQGVIDFELMVETAAERVCDILMPRFALPTDLQNEFPASAIWLGAVYHLAWTRPNVSCGGFTGSVT